MGSAGFCSMLRQTCAYRWSRFLHSGPHQIRHAALLWKPSCSPMLISIIRWDSCFSVKAATVPFMPLYLYATLCQQVLHSIARYPLTVALSGVNRLPHLHLYCVPMDRLVDCVMLRSRYLESLRAICGIALHHRQATR